MFGGGGEIRPSARFVSVETKLRSALLARPIVLNGVPLAPFRISPPFLDMMNEKSAPQERFFQSWRRGRDSNSRYLAVCWFSKPVLSTTQPPLHGSRFAKVPFFLILGYSFRVQFQLRPYRLTVRTPAFQAVNPGSIPGRVSARKSPP